MTTAPAATTAPSPIVTPGRTVALAPIHTFSAYDDRFRHHSGSVFRVQIVIQRRENDVMADERTVSDSDTALILKATAEIDKYIFSKCYIFSEIGVKRRVHAESFIYRFPRKL